MDPQAETLTYLDQIETELTELSKNDELPDISNLLQPVLQYCAANGMTRMCRLLLKFNAEMETDGVDWTPLMHSVRQGHIDVSQILLNYEDRNLISSNGADLISAAIASGDLNLVKYLLGKLKKTSRQISLLGRMSFIATACTYGFVHILKYLLDRYPNEINNAVEKSGMTPLMLAVAGRHISAVKLLLLHGADTSPRNSLDQTVFDIALSMNDEKIMALLGVQQPKTPTCCNTDRFTFQNQSLFPSLNQLTLPNNNSKSPTSNTLSPTNMFDYSPQCLTCAVRNGHESHPLTPNIFLSPKMSSYSSEMMSQNKLDSSALKRRSKSLENLYNAVGGPKSTDNQHLVDYILKENNLSDLSTLFEEHEITLRTFLSMDGEDLKDIGIQKVFVRQKLLGLINHYKQFFSF